MSLIVPFSVEATDALKSAMATFQADASDVYRLWVIDKDVRPGDDPMPAESLITSKSQIRYVTPFTHGRLMVYDAETGKYRPAKSNLMLALDSNLCSLLRQVFVEGSEKPEQVGAVIDLAKRGGPG